MSAAPAPPAPSAARRVVDRRSERRPRLHFIGICGKGMGAIAGALAREGWSITGSDENTYPPMSRCLDECGIVVRSPYDPANVPGDVDLVIVGKRVREENPELAAIRSHGLPYASFPAFLRDAFLEGSRNAVVSGGVGKTTTTAMLAFILERAGVKPDYLIGGLARDLAWPGRLTGAGVTVIEGDEYASCFDDPSPKFLKYAPEVLIVTNVIEDHPDLYGDAGAVEAAFSELARMLPGNGCLILPDDDDIAARLAASSCSPSIRVGFTDRADQAVVKLDLAPDRSSFRFMKADFSIRLAGRMNVRNAAMAVVAAGHFGVSPPIAAAALADFEGVVHRQDIRQAGNCTLVSDKASHPVALRALLESVRQMFPHRRVVSIVRPRATGGRNWVYQRELPTALAAADLVVLLDAYEHNPDPRREWRHDPFSVDLLAAELSRNNVEAVLVNGPDELPAALRAHLRERDVIVLTLPEQASDLRADVAAAASRL